MKSHSLTQSETETTRPTLEVVKGSESTQPNVEKLKPPPWRRSKQWWRPVRRVAIAFFLGLLQTREMVQRVGPNKKPLGREHWEKHDPSNLPRFF